MSVNRHHIQLVEEEGSAKNAGREVDAHPTDLVRRAQRGDVTAFERLASEHYQALYSFAMGLVGDGAEAADITQDALLKAYRKLDSYRFAAPFRSWLLQIVRNSFRDRMRQRQQHQTKQQRLAAHALAEMPADPEQQLMGKQVSLQVYGALLRLEPQFREVVVLFDLQGFAYREIAEICCIPMGTVKSRLRRGREGLRRLLVDDGVIDVPGLRTSGGGRR